MNEKMEKAMVELLGTYTATELRQSLTDLYFEISRNEDLPIEFVAMSHHVQTLIKFLEKVEES